MSNAKRFSLWGAAMATALLLAPAPVSAQRGFRGGFGGGHGGSFRGGGFRGGFVGGGHFRSGFGGFGSPFAGRGFVGRSFFGPRVFVGAPFFGFYSSFGYADPYYYYPPPAYSYYPPPSSSVVIVDRNSRYSGRYVEEYREPARVAPVESCWLLAFRDKSIVAATDYWMEGSTLNYITRDGKKASADIESVDVPFSRQLNRERGLEFRLPSSGPSGSGSGPRRLDSYGRPE